MTVFLIKLALSVCPLACIWAIWKLSKEPAAE